MPSVEVIVSMPLTVTIPVVRVFITLVVAVLLVESVLTKSVTLAPMLVMTDNVEKSRALMSVYPEMVEAVTVSVTVVKVVSTTVVPLAAVSAVSEFVLILSFVKLVMVFILVDMVANDPVLFVSMLGEVNTVIVVSMP
jgi:energy-converting hydrogenase Eha subunit A